MLRKLTLAFATVATLGAAALVPSTANAHWYGDGWYGKGYGWNYGYRPHYGHYGYHPHYYGRRFYGGGYRSGGYKFGGYKYGGGRRFYR